MKNQMITEVSHVISISGVARIRTPDGVLHELKVGDVLQPGTEVLLADATSFAFELGVPELAQPIDIPADQQPSMPAMGAAAGDQQATAQINALQQAILAGQDPTQAFEAAAAGVPADAGGTGAGSGNSGFVSIVRTGGSTIAEAGYDTTALASDPLLQVDDPVAPTVALINDPTVVVADTNTIEEDTVATGNVLANDSDSDDVLSVASFLVDGVIYVPGQTAELPNVGTLIINPDGSYTFEPVPNWNGNVPQITYTTNTGSSSTLDISITPVNDSPVDQNETHSVTEDGENTVVTGNALLNASDIDGDTLTVTHRLDLKN